MTIHAPSHDGFKALLRVASSSVADPPWFAPPVEAEEDSDAITVVFHLPPGESDQVRVTAADRSVTVWGPAARAPRPAMRLCALSCEVLSGQLEAKRSGELLRVRVLKKRATI